MKPSRRLRLLLVACLVPGLSGCGLASLFHERSTSATASQGAEVGDPQTANALIPNSPDLDLTTLDSRIANDTPIDKLTAWNNGPGLVVLEPSRPPTGALHDFGTGAAAWLQLNLAGQPAFGRSVTFASIDRATQEMAVTDMALTVTRGKELASRLGITHLAMGSLSGSAGACTLTYRIVDGVTGEPVGDPVSASGTFDTVTAQLPAMARTLNARLAGPSTFSPPPTGLSPADLAVLGRCRRGSSHLPADIAALERLSATSPLAGLFYIRSGVIATQTETNRVSRAAVANSHDNPIVFGDLGATDFEFSTIAPAVEAAYKAYPHNMLIALTEVKVARTESRPLVERKAAESVVRASPQNPETWLTLGWTISKEADAVRNARVITAMTDAEQAFVAQLYPQWEHCETNAVQLDPDFGRGWIRLATAASFNSDTQTAVKAFDNAHQCDPDRQEVFDWGLQMFQPKWYPDQTRLDRIAASASTASYDTTDNTMSIVGDLTDAGETEAAKTLLNRTEAQLTQEIQSSKSDPTRIGKAYWGLSDCATQRGNQRHAITEDHLAEKYLPNDPKLHYEVGTLLDQVNDIPGALKEYRQALALDPQRYQVCYDYGWDLRGIGQMPAAERVLREAIALDPDSDGAHYALGLVLESLNKISQAAPEYQRAVDLGNTDPQIYMALVGALDRTGQYQAALKYGKQDLLFNPKDANTMTNVADVYLRLNDGNGAVRLSNRALQLAPADAVDHANLAQGDQLLGRMSEARQQWHLVETLNDPTMRAQAQQFFAQYPGN